jgi:MFS transporter, UMF1 family
VSFLSTDYNGKQANACLGGNRKRLLLLLGYSGAAACMLFILVSPNIYLVAPVLALICVPCLGNSFVMLNSYLPLLVAKHPDAAFENNAMEESGIPLMPVSSSNDADDQHYTDELEINPIMPISSNIVAAKLKLSNQISAKAVGFGYLAAVFVQIISIIILLLFSKISPTISETTLPMRLVLFVVGIWWAAFTIPTQLWLRRRPGPPLPAQNKLKPRKSWFRWLPYMILAWKSLWHTARIAARLRQVTIFLIAWFLLCDAIATVSGTAILFAKVELQMATAAVAAVSVTATSAGIAGAYTWPIIQRKYEIPTNHIIIWCIALYEIIPIYGLLGFIPVVKTWGVGGLQQPWEIFPLAFISGFVMGGISSYCRSFFGMLIPTGYEAAFYALYAVTDKGSSVIGPAIVGRIVDSTGSIRPAFWFLAVLIVLPAPLIWFVDVAKGRADGLAIARRLDHSDNAQVNRTVDPPILARENEILFEETHE